MQVKCLTLDANSHNGLVKQHVKDVFGLIFDHPN